MLAAIGLACSESSKQEEVTLAAVSVSPASASLAKGTSRDLVATAVYTNNTKKDVTAEAAWAVSDGAVLSVLSPGVAKAMAVGAATVSATFEGKSGNATLTVTAAEVVSLAVTPFQIELPKGVPGRLTAMARMTDDTVQDVTRDATWSTSASEVAVCTSCGQVETRAEGDVTVTASFAGKQASSRLTVTAAQMVSLELQPATASVPKGMTEQMIAIGHFTDDSTQDLTEHVTWCTLDGEVASISNAQGSRGLVSALAPGSTEICAVYCNTWHATAQLTVTPAVPVSATISPPEERVPKGLSTEFRVSAVFSDGSSRDLTGEAVWESSDEQIATVGNADDEAGVALGVGVGSATITARIPESQVFAEASLEVTAAIPTALAVAPAEASIPKGLRRQFTATATMSDGSHESYTTLVTWGSSDDEIASISNAEGSEGEAEALEEGEVTITAVHPGSGLEASASLAVTGAEPVSLAVEPAEASIPKGLTQRFEAIATYTDGSHHDLTDVVFWASSDTDVASVSMEGIATGEGVGEVLVTATLSETISARASLAVREAEIVSILVEPIEVAKPKGLAQQFTATATYTDLTTADVTAFVTWTSSDPDVAPISNAEGSKGLASALDVGVATLTATSPNETSGAATMTVTREELVEIQVTPPHPVLPKGLRQQFTATGVYTDMSEQDLTATVTWSSSPEGIAMVHNELGAEGDTETLGVGIAEIVATYPGTLMHGHALIEVTAATLVKLEIEPPEWSMPKGLEKQFQATGVFTDDSVLDLTELVTWSSSDQEIASISSVGNAKGRAMGTVTIGAQYPGGPITDTATLTITMEELVSIAVSPPEASIPDGRTQRFTAAGTYTDGSERDVTQMVTWSKEDEVCSFDMARALEPCTVAEVSNTDPGLAKAVNPGSVSICATDPETEHHGCAYLEVTEAVLDSIEVVPASASTPKGLTAQFAALGTYSDGDVIDLTTDVTWTSSPEGAPVAGPGKFYGGAVGEYEVEAADAASGVVGEAALSVTPEELLSIEIAQSAASIPKGLTAQFSATGLFTDESTRDYTGLVTWKPSDDAIASISNAEGSKGLATGLAVGSVTIWAVDPVTGFESNVLGLEVLPARLTGLRIAPPDQQLPAGTIQEFAAIGSYTDGIDRDVTGAVEWGSDPWQVAYPLWWEYDYAPGVFLAWEPGEATISARYVDLYVDVTAYSSLYVTDVAIAALILYPDLQLPVGACQSVSAEAQFAGWGGYSYDVRNSIAWSSNDEAIATVTNFPDDVGGYVCGVTVGGAVISGVASNGVSDTVLVNVYEPEPPM
jgi:uncharacterized protein YjdB